MHERHPPHLLIGALLALTLALPAASALGVSEVGGFRMFTRFVFYRVSVSTSALDGTLEELTPRQLWPHLGRDARRVVGQAHRFVPGEAAATLVEGGLPDLAQLGCAIQPSAVRAVAVLERKGLDGRRNVRVESEARCGR